MLKRRRRRKKRGRRKRKRWTYRLHSAPWNRAKKIKMESIVVGFFKRDVAVAHTTAIHSIDVMFSTIQRSNTTQQNNATVQHWHSVVG